MTDRTFRGGYLVGVATALALDGLALVARPALERNDGGLDVDEVRIGVLSLAVLVGVVQFSAERFGSRYSKRNGHRDFVESGIAGAPEPHLGDRAADSGFFAEPRKPLARQPAAEIGSPTSSPPDPDPSEPDALAANLPVRPEDGSPPEQAGHPEARPDQRGTAHVTPEPALPTPGDVIRVWEEYWQKGDGHFRPDGFARQLDDSGFTARVVDGAAVDAGQHVLIVDPQSADGQVFVLPSFAAPPRAVRQWFDDRSDGALTATTRRVIAVAVGRTTETGAVEVVRKGAVS